MLSVEEYHSFFKDQALPDVPGLSPSAARRTPCLSPEYRNMKQI